MTDAPVSTEAFLTKITAVLQATQETLAQLGTLALLENSRRSASPKSGDMPAAGESPHNDLAQIGRRLLDLAQRNQEFKLFLQNNGGAPAPAQSFWPQVKILQSQEEARMQTARLMEENVGQLLANAVFELASCRQGLAANSDRPVDCVALSNDLSGLQFELEQGLTDFRQHMVELDPTTILANFGLGNGVRRYLEQFEAKTGLATRLQVNANFGRLPTIVEMAIFRVIQEALHNAARHAGASRVEVLIDEHQGQLRFSVIDNGRGMTPQTGNGNRRNFGLARMMDYADLLGGQVRVLSEPGHGTQVVLAIPYPVI